MAFHVRDEATDEAVRRLAKLKGKSLTTTIRKRSKTNTSANATKCR